MGLLAKLMVESLACLKSELLEMHAIFGMEPKVFHVEHS